MLNAMPVQLVTRVSDEVARRVDDLVRDGVFASRSDAVRAGLDAVIERSRRDAVGRAIVDGDRRAPQSDDDLAWPDAATVAMIGDQPG
jgi:Arc/MetJ-type ribon-helix-helix transcriptional regulator